MASCRDIDRLAQRIRRIVAGNTCLTAAVRRYIDATFADPSPSTLAAVLAEPVTSESAPLCELIFFPNLDLQLEIEDFLLAKRFEASDEAALVRCFQTQPPVAGFYYGKENRHLSVTLPSELAGPFVARLRISGRPDARLADTLRNCLPDGTGLRAFVLLRNAARTPGPAAIDWLCRLAGVAGAALDSGDFLDHLAFALDVVQDLPEGTDVLPYMENRRAACRAALETSGLAAARQRDVPVEIVLLSRTAAPFVDRAEARRQIAMIDLMSALTH